MIKKLYLIPPTAMALSRMIEDILDAATEHQEVGIMHTDALVTMPGWGETIWGEAPVGWAAVIIAMEEESLEASE